MTCRPLKEIPRKRSLLQPAFTCLFLSVAALVPQQAALAQKSAVLEEIIVTSRHYQESIQDAPLAVAVMSDEYLKNQGVNNINDILELTPGTTWTDFTKAQPSLSMRGIWGDSFGNSSLETSVQIVTDGVTATKAFMMTPAIFDLERVEIMRGPQGTTFGRNSTIGLIHLITKRPTQEFESEVNLSAGDRDLFGIDGFISGGLSETVSGRLAFNYDTRDGDIEHYQTGKALEATQNTTIRGSLLIKPNDNFTAFLKVEFSQDDDMPNLRRGESCTVPWLASPPYIQEWTNPCSSWKSAQSPPPPGGFFTERDMTHLTAELTWAVGNDLTVTSVSGLADASHHTVQDVLGSPEVIRDQIVKNDATVYSTELRLDNSASSNSLHWLVGVYLLSDEEDRFEDNFDFPARGVGAGRIVPQPEAHLQTISHAETTSYALFGEVSFDLSERTNLTVGGRFTDDSRDYDFAVDAWGRAGSLAAVGLDGPVERDCAENTVAGICGTEANPMGLDKTSLSGSWDNFSAKLSLSYAISDDLNIYALYSEGFKSGGFQHDARNLSGLVDNVIGEEEATNYELGLKGSYDRAQFAVTLFRIELDNAQNNALIPVGASGSATSLVTNFGGIENDGVELEGTFLFGENFTVGGSVALYDSKLGPGSLSSASLDPMTGKLIGTDASGQEPNNAPEETYAIFAEYFWLLGGGSNITLRADVQHRSEAWASLNGRSVLTTDGSALAFQRPEIDNIGARLRWTAANGNTSISLWGENLGDEFDWKTFGPPIGFHFNQGSAPRGFTGRSRVGVDASFRFN